MARSYLERVLLGEERGTLSWGIRGLLWPLALIYRVGLTAYLALYRLGLRKRHRLPTAVISIGNLTFGGTGKTPSVQTICRILQQMGKRVAILSRGYGGVGSDCVVVSDGVAVLADATECGDEPVLLARTLPGIPVIVGKNRCMTGELAYNIFRPDVFVLDDGLQYWQLHRDLDIVVVDAAKPFGSGFLMPMGDLREPVGGLKRAGVVLINNSDSTLPTESTVRILSDLARDALIARAKPLPVILYAVGQDRDVGPEWLRGKKIAAFCGIGRPDYFLRTLESLGASVEMFIEFSDHHWYNRKELQSIEEKSIMRGVEAIVTTEKDWARIDNKAKLQNLYVLGIKLEIEEIKQLAKHIADRIDGASKAIATS